jgi:hypothetical protein
VNEQALVAVEAILASDREPDDLLRAVVGALVDHGACAWAAIVFVEGSELALGPQSGVERPGERRSVRVVYRGDHVADLVGDGCGDPGLLERLAAAIAAHCLVGWDTRGVPWDDVA